MNQLPFLLLFKYKFTYKCKFTGWFSECLRLLVLLENNISGKAFYIYKA